MNLDKIKSDLSLIEELLELIFKLYGDYAAACTLAQASQDKIKDIRNELSRE